MTYHKKLLVTGFVCLVFFAALIGSSYAAWGSKELDTEKIAVQFAREVIKGGYKIVSTEELKGWIDQKKDMLIVDTMPYEDSYKKTSRAGRSSVRVPDKRIVIS